MYRINEIGRRAGDVISYVCLFVSREKSIKCGSLCNVMKGHVSHTYFRDNGKLPKSGGGGGFPVMFGPD